VEPGVQRFLQLLDRASATRKAHVGNLRSDVGAIEGEVVDQLVHLPRQTQAGETERREHQRDALVALALAADPGDRELVVGTTGPGSNAHDFPLLLKEFAGAKFKLVSGYPANADVLLAIERKEVDVWAAFATTIKLAADRGAVRPLVRGRVALKGWEHLPVDEDLATSSVGKAIMAIRAAPLAIGRAFAAPPATPADRVKVLREAFAKAVQDPEFIAESQKARIEVGYIPPEEVLKMFNALLEQPADVQKEMVKYIKFGS